MMLLGDTTIRHSDGVYEAILLLFDFMFVFSCIGSTRVSIPPCASRIT
jgi:hypothetical protein